MRLVRYFIGKLLNALGARVADFAVPVHGLRVACALSSSSISAALVLRNARIAIAAVMARSPEDCDWRK
jgi:hypothetical protein